MIATRTMSRTTRLLPVAFAVAGALTLGFRAAASAADDAEQQFNLATRLFSEAKYVEALAAFDTALRSDDVELARRARKGKVRSALRIAEFSLARREAETLTDATPADPEAVALHADALWANGLFDEAETRYRSALDSNPGSSRARLGVARALAQRSRLDEALNEALTAQGADPRDYQIPAIVGDLYARLNRFDDAANSYASYQALLAPSEVASAMVSQGQINFLRSFKGRTPLAIKDDVAAQTHTVPFRLAKNKVLVRVQINGRYTTELVLDTGAERIGLSSETARRAGVAPVSMSVIAGVGAAGYRPLALARAETLQIGSLRIANVPVSIRNAVTGTMPRWQSETFSPVSLGLSVEVDYKRKRVTLARRLPDGPADVRLPMRIQRLPPLEAAQELDLRVGDERGRRLGREQQRLVLLEGVGRLLEARQPGVDVAEDGVDLVVARVRIARREELGERLVQAALRRQRARDAQPRAGRAGIARERLPIPLLGLVEEPHRPERIGVQRADLGILGRRGVQPLALAQRHAELADAQRRADLALARAQGEGRILRVHRPVEGVIRLAVARFVEQLARQLDLQLGVLRRELCGPKAERQRRGEDRSREEDPHDPGHDTLPGTCLTRPSPGAARCWRDPSTRDSCRGTCGRRSRRAGSRAARSVRAG